MKSLIIITVLLFLTSKVFASVEIFNTKAQKIISQIEFTNELPESANIVMGEYHYQEAIQKAEAEIIEMIVKAKKLEGNFTLGWEFLDYPHQENITDIFSLYIDGNIDDAKLLASLFPKSSKPEQNIPYLPMLQITKKYNGELIGLNAPRSWKRIITKGGFDSLDPKYIPVNMERGSKNYFKRFEDIMGGHIDAEKLENYFMAQSYTDAVMVWALEENSQYDYRFAVAGAFHTDFNDGFVDMLKKYDSNRETVSIKIIQSSELSSEELSELKEGDSKYGQYGDYLYIIHS
jgi:uncharacterized iron-regulated protein